VEWMDRLASMYQFFNQTPALAHDMATKGPQDDFSYNLAYGMANGPTPLDVYPADSQTLEG